jgi:flagellar biosynthetic protein FliR
MFDLIFQRYTVFLMVFARMSGMLFFNPILGRKSVPSTIKIGLAFVTAILITYTLGGVSIAIRGTLDMMICLVKELLIGFAVGVLLQMYLSVLMMAGEVIDMQIGIGMSKVYDPQSNLSMPLTGTILNLMYTLLFFGANGHLSLIKLVSLSFNILPPGPQFINFNFGSTAVSLFAELLILTIKISIPIIAIEMLSEAGVGVLMRMVPQINVFVISLQLKLLLGLIMITLLLPNISGIINATMQVMFDNMEKVIVAMT